MTITANGYHDTTLQLQLDGDVTRDIRLRPRDAATLTIRTIDKISEEQLGSFVYAIPGFLPSTAIDSDATTIVISQDVDYTVVVGDWGYRTERRTFRVDEETNEMTIALTPGYTDDATLDLGWQSEDGEGASLTGRWGRIEPYLGYPRSDWVHPPYEPTGTTGWIFFTGAPPRFAPPERDDVSFGRASMVSPLMDLSDYVRPLILFDRWFVHFERDTILDAFIVEMSSDDGASWTEVYREVKGKAGWQPVVIFPTDHLALTERMRLRVSASDTLGNILVVAGIDNFEVVNRAASGVEAEGTPSENEPRITLEPGLLRLQGANGPVTITIHTIDGRRVANLYDGPAPGDLLISLPDLPPAPYIITARTNEGGVVVKGLW